MIKSNPHPLKFNRKLFSYKTINFYKNYKDFFFHYLSKCERNMNFYIINILMICGHRQMFSLWFLYLVKQSYEKKCETNTFTLISFSVLTAARCFNQRCYRCEAGWEHHGGKYYHFSISKSSWNQSRADCGAKGGDLVKIDSREEQVYLMSENQDRFWIGLTDSAEEGRWMWVDNTPLNESFWLSWEPDNWRGINPEGENCVRMGGKTSNPDLKSWNDMSCLDPSRSICEKAEIIAAIVSK
uniref:C-type lectin domain-containing protein n=1 Tax=Amphilophus citrinellus TaxID=61819 RepID=A0A3Q0T2B6_AMPCI